MRFAVVVLALCALSVQGLPSQKSLPEGLESFKPEHVLSYVQKLAAEQLFSSRMAVSGRAASNNMVCYQESSAALQEVATKSEEGNTKCNNILTNAQTQADNELEENRKTLDEESQDIQISLTSCDASTLPNAADALECYEAQGQKNVNPVSSLSSKSRSYRRGYENTLNLAKTASDGCSFDVASESEQISAQIFNNLNSCITSGQWDPVDIPDFGPADPTTKAPTTASTATPTTEDNSVPDPETTLEPEI